MNESCESKVANLLASICELSTSNEKICLLVSVIEELQRQIEEQEKAKKQMDDHVINILENLKEIAKMQWNEIMKKAEITVYDGKGTHAVRTFEMHLQGEDYVWFRARTKKHYVDSLCLKGEV